MKVMGMPIVRDKYYTIRESMIAAMEELGISDEEAFDLISAGIVSGELKLQPSNKSVSEEK